MWLKYDLYDNAGVKDGPYKMVMESAEIFESNIAFRHKVLVDVGTTVTLDGLKQVEMSVLNLVNGSQLLGLYKGSN